MAKLKKDKMYGSWLLNLSNLAIHSHYLHFLGHACIVQMLAISKMGK